MVCGLLYEAVAAVSEQFSQVWLVHLFFSSDRAVILILCVLTLEQEVIYKGPVLTLGVFHTSPAVLVD